MPTFIVTIEFGYSEDATYAVEAESAYAAIDHAMDRLIEDPYADRPEAGHADTIAEFEANYGTYTDGMFPRI